MRRLELFGMIATCVFGVTHATVPAPVRSLVLSHESRGILSLRTPSKFFMRLSRVASSSIAMHAVCFVSVLLALLLCVCSSFAGGVDVPSHGSSPGKHRGQS